MLLTRDAAVLQPVVLCSAEAAALTLFPQNLAVSSTAAEAEGSSLLHLLGERWSEWLRQAVGRSPHLEQPARLEWPLELVVSPGQGSEASLPLGAAPPEEEGRGGRTQSGLLRSGPARVGPSCVSQLGAACARQGCAQVTVGTNLGGPRVAPLTQRV